MNTAPESVALVTGASSGIGRSIACALARRCSRVGIAGRDRQRLAQTATATGLAGPCVLIQPCDLAVDECIRKLAARVTNDFGRLDVLVHSAGTIRLGTVESVEWEDFDELYRVNVRAPFLLTRLLLPLLKQSRGQVVFVNSTASLLASSDNTLYAASKQALRSIANSVRMHAGSSGVRVLSVFPGRTATPMQEYVHRFEHREYDPSLLLQPDDVAELVMHAIEMPRSAEVSEIVMRPANWSPERSPR